MRIGHRSNAKEAGAAPHRRGGIHFTYLLDGEPEALDNYSLSIVQFVEEYSTPRHRHNFEQVRVMLEGEFSYAPGAVQKEGSVGYFCEGGYYTQKGLGPSRTLLLQVAGPSGDGYMSHDTLRGGGAELDRIGSFDDGVYSWTDEQGCKHNKDGYEAVWEHVNGRPLRYVGARYTDPVIMHPEAFEFLEVQGADGAETRLLGKFQERGLTITQLRLKGGACFPAGDGERVWVYFAVAGEGRANGEPWGAESAIHVDPGEEITFEAETDSLFYAFGLPAFADARADFFTSVAA